MDGRGALYFGVTVYSAFYCGQFHMEFRMSIVENFCRPILRQCLEGALINKAVEDRSKGLDIIILKFKIPILPTRNSNRKFHMGPAVGMGC